MAKSIECKACGNVYSSAEAKCPYCGEVNPEQAVNQQAQPHINVQPQPQVVYVQQPVGNYNKGPLDKTTAILLCLFLGYLGAHKFYEGKTGAGVLYLFTGGLFFVGVFIDLISLLGKPSKYYV